jgi:hypothetical protein
MPDPWPVWLVRRLLPLLAWVAARCGYTLEQPQHTTVTYGTLETADLWLRVAQHRDVVERLSGRTAQYLVLGRDMYQDLITETLKDTFFSIHMQESQYQGLTLLLCPWVEGLCVLPEVIRG